MKRASYRHGIEWIGENDEPSDLDSVSIKSYISSLLLADLFGVPSEKVGEDVRNYRLKKRKKYDDAIKTLTNVRR